MNASISEQGRGFPSDLKDFRCPYCSEDQPFVCPGFGQHSPSPTLIRSGNHAQCTQCQAHIAHITCGICGQVTALTTDILDDPIGTRYWTSTKVWQDASRFYKLDSELSKRYGQVQRTLMKFAADGTAIDETTITELQTILAEYERLLESLPKKYPPLKPYSLRKAIADTQLRIAESYQNLYKSQEAILYYNLASQTNHAIGRKEKVEWCLEGIARIQLQEEGIIDDDLQRRQAQLEVLPRETEPHIRAMLGLGQVYRDAGDKFAAQEVLLVAEKEFQDFERTFDRVMNNPLLSEVQRDAFLAFVFPDWKRVLEGKQYLKNDSSGQAYAYGVNIFVNVWKNTLQEDVYYMLGSLYKDDHLEEAIRYFRLARPKNPIPLQQHSYALMLKEAILRYDIKTLPPQNHPWRRKFVAADLLRRAQALEARIRRWKIPAGITAVQLDQADILLAMQRDDEAIIVLSTAMRELKKGWMHTSGVQILRRLVQAYAHQQQWQRVSSLCDEGIQLVEEYRYKVTSQYMQSAYLTSRIELYAWGVRAAYKLSDYPLMLERAELSKSRSVLRYQRQGLTLTEELQQIERKFQSVSEQIASADPDSKLLDELLRKRRTLWDLLTVQRFQSRTGKSLPVFSLEAVQATLAADEAIIYYYWLDRYTLLIAIIDQHQVVPVIRTLSEEQHSRLKAFAEFVLKLKPDDTFSHLNSVRDFSALLLPEEGSTLLAGKQRLLISPHRLLHALPFHALPWQGRFLIQSFAVSYAPNLSSLLVRFSPAQKQKLFALGVREYHFAVKGMPLPSLKQAEHEIETLSMLYEAHAIPTIALKGVEAQPERLRQLQANGDLRTCSQLHFATHGLNVNSDTPMESHLFLQEATLDGLEIANWQLNADVVVLSACCSGQRPIAGRGMQELPGDELFGLQSAFFMAGARRILSCLWPVNDLSATQITVAFHHHVADGKQPERALQAAISEYLETAGLERRKIYYWAPFFLSVMGRPDPKPEEKEHGHDRRNA